MLNTNIRSNQNFNTNVKINSCNGGIYKTCYRSFFMKFNLNSNFADRILRQREPLNNDSWKSSSDEVQYIALQMIICGDMEVIAELIKPEDYDELLDINEDSEVE